jgi:hypothetical protein
VIEEVAEIAAISDPAIRNLRITQCYSELSRAMAERTGSKANWCTFATWASKQAGVSIRKEDLKSKIEHAIETAPAIVQALLAIAWIARDLGANATEERVREVLRGIINRPGRFNAIERASDAAARGNYKVFDEIGREFARFLTSFGSKDEFDEKAIGRFCETLRVGEPPDGQWLLRQAFIRYYRAFFETDQRVKDEMMFLANAEIGFHEQTRLQPEITEALDSPLLDAAEFKRELLRELFPFQGWWAWLKLITTGLFRGPTPLDRAIERLVSRLREIVHHVITNHLLTLSLSDGSALKMGQDLSRAFPVSLSTLTMSDALELMRQIDPTLDSTRESGAEDWANLKERMHFIVDFFRCYHEDQRLFDPPFTQSQIEEVRAGRVPEDL